MNPRQRIVLGCVAVLVVTTGCNLAALPFLLWGEEKTRDVPAAYPYLQDKDVLVLVWAETATLFEYPHLRYELNDHIAQALESRVKGVECIAPKRVAAMQDSEPEWDKRHPSFWGQRFQADRVLLVEVLEAGTREPGATHLYRGRIVANAAVYDPEYGRRAGPAWESDDAIRAVYPEAGPGAYGVDDDFVRRMAMEQFALELAGKFYDRKEKVSQR